MGKLKQLFIYSRRTEGGVFIDHSETNRNKMAAHEVGFFPNCLFDKYAYSLNLEDGLDFSFTVWKW